MSPLFFYFSSSYFSPNFVARPIFPQKFVARPIFRINIYGSYFVKIEKMVACVLARPYMRPL